MLKAPEFKQSATTQLVYDLFIKASNSDSGLVTWLELTKATHSTRSDLKGSITTVKKRLVADHGVVFENDRDIGYRMVLDPDLAEIGQKTIERTRRYQRTGLKKMDCADVAKLSPEQRIRHITRRTVLELGLASSTTRTMKNVDQMVLRKHNQLTGEEQIQAIKDALTSKK